MDWKEPEMFEAGNHEHELIPDSDDAGRPGGQGCVIVVRFARARRR